MLICYLQCSNAEGQFSLKEIGSSYSTSASVALGFEVLYLNDVTLQGRWCPNRLPKSHNFCQVAMMTFSLLVMAHYKQWITHFKCKSAVWSVMTGNILTISVFSSHVVLLFVSVVLTSCIAKSDMAFLWKMTRWAHWSFVFSFFFLWGPVTFRYILLCFVSDRAKWCHSHLGGRKWQNTGPDLTDGGYL